MIAIRAGLASASHRGIAIALALAIGTLACGDVFGPGDMPDDEPGEPVAGLPTACPTSACLTWSHDSKKLYLVTTLAAPLGVSLVAVDPATRTFERIGSIDGLAVAFVLSPDGTTMFFSVPEDPTKVRYDLLRMSLTTGVTTFVAKTSSHPESIPTPDGTALAYHTTGSDAGADTIVLLDLATGARRATTFGVSSFLRGFSGDGTRLLMSTGQSDPFTIKIWRVDTGARDSVATTSWAPSIRDIRWSRGAFRVLFAKTHASPTLTDTALGGGPAITYSAARNPSPIAWLPDRSALFMAVSDGRCWDDEGCYMHHYEFVYSSPTKTAVPGSMNAPTLYFFAASPDGKWLAHQGTFAPLYFVSQPQP